MLYVVTIGKVSSFTKKLNKIVLKIEVEALDVAVERLNKELVLHDLNITYNKKRDGVYSIMIKFGGLLYEAGMSYRQTQNP